MHFTKNIIANDIYIYIFLISGALGIAFLGVADPPPSVQQPIRRICVRRSARGRILIRRRAREREFSGPGLSISFLPKDRSVGVLFFQLGVEVLVVFQLDFDIFCPWTVCLLSVVRCVLFLHWVGLCFTCASVALSSRGVFVSYVKVCYVFSCASVIILRKVII